MELYGISAGLGPSESQTPVSLKTNIVFIGGAGIADHLNEPIKCTSYTDFETKYPNATGDSLVNAAMHAFKVCGLNEAWFINASASAENEITYTEINAAIEHLDDIYRDHGVIPNVVVLPYNDWRSNGTNSAITASTKCSKIADYFKAQVFYDVKVASTNVTVDSAGHAKFNTTSIPTKECDNENCIACLGYMTTSDEKHIPMSVVAACNRVVEDAVNAGGVPYRSVGNLRINGAVAYEANVYTGDTNDWAALSNNNKDICDTMAANGFIVAINRGQKRFYTWGDHTASVHSDEGNVDDERARFDSYIAIAYHIVNRFILKWMNVIDDPMTLALRNDIINEEQNYLDYLVSIGALIGAPKCEFRSINNTTDTLQRGQFYFTNINTYAVPAKYIDLKVVYTSAGIESYIIEGE